MSRTAQIITACSTFSVALGIGFVMQNGDALAGRFTDESAAPTLVSQPLVGPMPQVAAGGLPPDLARDAGLPELATPPQIALPELAQAAANLPQDTDAPMFAADEVLLAAAEMTGTEMETLPLTPTDPVAQLPLCDAILSAEVGPAAMVDLSLTAPCAPDTAIIVHHQGLMFTLLTDTAGQAKVSVPALAEVAVFVAELGNGEGAAASVLVPELAAFDRAVLQWQGLGGMQLHALEFGASYTGAGHVWAGAARDAGITVAGAGGFITSLGDARADAPRMAEIYTFPSAAATQAGAVDLSVEAEITAANCGRDVVAQSIQIMRGQELAVVDLTMTMPDCSAVGEFLVLDTMLQDLTLAAR